MSDFNIVGTPDGCSYGGLDFRVKADASITEMLRSFSSEVIPTTGLGMHKKEKAVQTLSGFPFTVNQDERRQLDELADTGPHKFDYTDGAGFTITGQAILGGDSSRTSDEGTYTADVGFMSKPTILNP